MAILSNRHWRVFLYRYEVPDQILTSEFEHLPDETDGFLHYRQGWYHRSDFLCIARGTGLAPWDGYLSTSPFTGILLRLSPDGEQYQVGSFYG